MTNTTGIEVGQRWLGKFGIEYEIVRIFRYDRPRWSYRVQYRSVNNPAYIYDSDALSFYNKHGLLAATT